MVGEELTEKLLREVVELGVTEIGVRDDVVDVSSGGILDRFPDLSIC